MINSFGTGKPTEADGFFSFSLFLPFTYNTKIRML